ncbi:OB-fold domain-containing protein [Kosmotoga sp. DU53]|uniref:OB-fold domain-containing protein n=1 Tax=Kosmotoga sp. DU53 TaxID=1310160 RepID=UPI00128FE03A
MRELEILIKGVEGEITEISGNEVTLKAGQFYLNILCSTNTIKELSLSAKVHLLTYLSFSADRAPEIYGFKDRAEYNVFLMLLKANKNRPKNGFENSLCNFSGNASEDDSVKRHFRAFQIARIR